MARLLVLPEKAVLAGVKAYFIELRRVHRAYYYQFDDLSPTLQKEILLYHTQAYTAFLRAWLG
jgi:hypothetical protein